jgi:SAM-dependent methyltransferase
MRGADVPGDDHWPRHARQWALIGPPLRPVPADVAALCAPVAHLGPAPRALVLGVTPELVGAPWPAATRPIAVERSAEVIAALGPRAPASTRALLADWRALPLAAGAIDLVVGDGALTNLRFPDDYRALAAELARVLAPGGRVALRLFAAPAVAEPLDAVAAALAAGAIGSFHALKWRVAMAIQPADRNVAVVDIGRAVEALCGDRAALAARTGWPRAVIDAIASYRGSGLRYSFPTQAEVIAALGDALAVVDIVQPGYELGERCPTVVWARR